jgi:membrane associated rhomboid family serine protease
MTPWVGRLLTLNVLAYILTFRNPMAMQLFALRPVYILAQPWSFVTYMFLHGGLMHLGFNMLILYFIGPRLELRLGGNRFIRLYLFAGFGGGLLSFAEPFSAVIGASGAVLGLLTAYAAYWPDDIFYFFLFLPLKARWLVIIYTLWAIWGSFFGMFQGSTAHFAHLGGLGAGFLYVKWMDRKSPARQFKAKAYAVPDVKVKSAKPGNIDRWKNINRDGLHEINRDELDRILEKITSVGVDTLTLDERAFLDRFSTS